MKIIPFISLLLFLFINSANGMGTHSEQVPQKDNPSILKSFTTASYLIGRFFLEVITFDPQTPQNDRCKKKYKSITRRVSDKLVIIAPSNIDVKRDGHYLIINGEYYDSTLKGELHYRKNGQLFNKKGATIDPLV